MANIFAITTPAPTVKAGSDGKASVVFTATNNTGRLIRGVGKTEAAGNTEQAWLKIEGENERDFSPGGTQQFTVNFSKPGASANPSAPQPAQKFPFSFSLYDVANPDENFTEGPTVTIETEEVKAKEPGKFPWWIIPVAAIALVVIGGAIWYLASRGGDKVEVPDVEKRLIDDAESRLKGFNVVKVYVSEPSLLPNQVVSQDPKPGTKIPAGGTVTLRVAEQPVTVPNFVGLTFGQALDALKKANLELGNITGDREGILNGMLVKVKAQAPPTGEPASKGAKVDLVFPCGFNEPCPVTVYEHDDYLGRSQSFNEGVYTTYPGYELNIVGDNIISSVRVKEGYVAKLCPNYQEDAGCRDFTAGDWNSLSKFNMNDVTSYIKVWKVR
jgi:hypothetical protein